MADLRPLLLLGFLCLLCLHLLLQLVEELQITLKSQKDNQSN